MKRAISKYLEKWKEGINRKPLLLRGARQVGKTWIVRDFAKSFSSFVEINFEREPNFKTLFEHDFSASRLLRDMALAKNISPIQVGKVLIFFDEIQDCPNALKSLRYFYEECPDLHIIAAGSLLDFALEEVGVPVGRVQFLHLYPLSFQEFLWAKNLEQLSSLISEKNLKEIEAFPEMIHKKLQDLLGEYLAVGGMPETVKLWIQHEDFSLCQEVHRNLIQSYQQDFLKYGKKHQVKYLDSVMMSIPKLIGQKFVYSKVMEGGRGRELSFAFDLLEKSKIAYRVYHSSGNGVPLGAEKNQNRFKPLFLDVALMQSLLGWEGKEWIWNFANSVINRASVLEAFVGQEILAYASASLMPQIYYWNREERGSLAEVDYLWSYQDRVVPIEVKSGEGRQSKRLKVFLEEKKQSPYGIQFSPMNLSIQKVAGKKIFHLPFYLLPLLNSEVSS